MFEIECDAGGILMMVGPPASCWKHSFAGFELSLGEQQTTISQHIQLAILDEMKSLMQNVLTLTLYIYIAITQGNAT